MKNPVLLALVLLGVACGDGDPAGARVTSPVTLDDPATAMPAAALPADLCEIIPQVANAELLCNDHTFCGNGGLCVEPIGRVQGQCAQVCFPPPPDDMVFPEGWDPSFDGCPGSCDGGICATLIDDAGQPILLALNLDGTPDVVGGACQTDAVGDQAAYDPCGSDGVCGAGLACFSLPDRDVGTCFPECTTTCEAFDSYPARCSGTTTETNVCLIACDSAVETSCPAGFECVENARGNYTCVR